MTGWVQGYDAISANFAMLPAGMQAAGYTTGTPDIQWKSSQWAAKPGAVRICQDYGLSDATADVADIEPGAGTPAQAAQWVIRARQSIAEKRRQGQRKTPCTYQSASEVTAVVNQFVANNIVSGVGLWVANWNLTEQEAVAEVLAAAGPFPIVAIQYADHGPGGLPIDSDIFSASWLAAIVGTPAPPPPPPTIREGDKGGWVAVCQRALNVHGSAPSLAIDSDFGPLTLQSVRHFQHMEAITVDGIVGPITWGKLGY